MQNDSPPDQRILDQILLEVFCNLLPSDFFTQLVDEACIKVTGKSTPAMRAIVRQAFDTKVGL